MNGTERDRANRPRLIRGVIAGAVLLGVAIALAAILDIGPFNSSSPELTKTQFIAKANAICLKAHAQFEKLQESPPNTSVEAAALTNNLISISKSELGQIESLNPPDELKPALARYLQAREQGIALLEKGLHAAENKDAQAYARAQAEIATGQVKRLRLAKAVGFTQCSLPAGSAATGTGQ